MFQIVYRRCPSTESKLTESAMMCVVYFRDSPRFNEKIKKKKKTRHRLDGIIPGGERDFRTKRLFDGQKTREKNKQTNKQTNRTKQEAHDGPLSSL